MQLTKLSPNLMVQNVKKSIEYYQTILGFSVAMAVDEDKNIHFSEIPAEKRILYALIVKDGVEIMFQQQESMKEDIPAFSEHSIGASVSFYITVEDIDQLYARMKKQVDCIKELETTWYSMREFYIRDIDGYILCFAEAANK